jgi:hypothetical protein
MATSLSEEIFAFAEDVPPNVPRWTDSESPRFAVAGAPCLDATDISTVDTDSPPVRHRNDIFHQGKSPEEGQMDYRAEDRQRVRCVVDNHVQ